MANTQFTQNATDVLIYISTDSGSTYSIVGLMQNASLSVTMDVRDVTTKQSGGWKQINEGLRSWSLSGDGLITYNALNVTGSTTPVNIFDYVTDRTYSYIKFGSSETGTKYYEGEGYFTSYEESGGYEDTETYSFSFEGSAQLTQSTN